MSKSFAKIKIEVDKLLESWEFSPYDDEDIRRLNGEIQHRVAYARKDEETK